jgi:polyadenylate-binding protein
MNAHPSYANASLYVGDLHPEVTESQLFEIFKQTGPVASIRVCRDAVTRRSLGYAYVNYHNVQDAERALDLLNYKEIKGRPCRIMWSQRDPALRRSNVGNIFIKNLHKSIDNKALYDTFSTFGSILSCKVCTDENGNSKGFGFIHYDTQDAADKATIVSGKLLNGKKCFVGPFIPKKERNDKDEAGFKWTNIYVKFLDKSVDDDKLGKMFEPFGKITSAVVMKDDKGESKGFGFINFEDNGQAQVAIDTLNGKEGGEGKQLYVGRAQKKGERERELKDMFLKLQRERMSKYQGVNLYVKNLDDTIDDEKLRTEFTAAGTITSAKVMTDDKKNSKGFGFVCFATPEEATKAVTEYNGKLVAGKPIYVALAQRKDQRRLQLEAQYAQRASGIRLQQAQAQGMAGNPMYSAGAPIFYPPARGTGFVYPQMMPRGRFPQQRGVPQYGMPGFMVPPPGATQGPTRGMPKGRGGPKSGRGGNVGPVQGYPMGIKYNANVRNQQVPAPQNLEQAAVPVPVEDRRQQIGEQLYPQIEIYLANTNQQELSGKITGMFLESIEQPELLQLLESSEALAKKVQEALEVLAAHIAETKKD